MNSWSLETWRHEHTSLYTSLQYLTSGFCSRAILTGCDELSIFLTSFTRRSLGKCSFKTCHDKVSELVTNPQTKHSLNHRPPDLLSSHHLSQKTEENKCTTTPSSIRFMHACVCDVYLHNETRCIAISIQCLDNVLTSCYCKINNIVFLAATCISTFLSRTLNDIHTCILVPPMNNIT